MQCNKKYSQVKDFQYFPQINIIASLESSATQIIKCNSFAGFDNLWVANAHYLTFSQNRTNSLCLFMHQSISLTTT